jgi:hypothetical protein
MTSPSNNQHAACADAAIRNFCKDTGCDLEDSLGDLLCDLMHWAKRERLDFELVLDQARSHFEAEVQP